MCWDLSGRWGLLHSHGGDRSVNGRRRIGEYDDSENWGYGVGKGRGKETDGWMTTQVDKNVVHLRYTSI